MLIHFGLYNFICLIIMIKLQYKNQKVKSLILQTRYKVKVKLGLVSYFFLT